MTGRSRLRRRPVRRPSQAGPPRPPAAAAARQRGEHQPDVRCWCFAPRIVCPSDAFWMTETSEVSQTGRDAAAITTAAYLQALPFLSVNSSLLQDPCKEFATDVTTVRIGNA